MLDFFYTEIIDKRKLEKQTSCYYNLYLCELLYFFCWIKISNNYRRNCYQYFQNFFFQFTIWKLGSCNHLCLLNLFLLLSVYKNSMFVCRYTSGQICCQHCNSISIRNKLETPTTDLLSVYVCTYPIRIEGLFFKQEA